MMWMSWPPQQCPGFAEIARVDRVGKVARDGVEDVERLRLEADQAAGGPQREQPRPLPAGRLDGFAEREAGAGRIAASPQRLAPQAEEHGHERAFLRLARLLQGVRHHAERGLEVAGSEQALGEVGAVGEADALTDRAK